MNQTLVVTTLFALTVACASSARAELLHVELKTLGMD